MNTLIVLTTLFVPMAHAPADEALVQGKPLSYWIDMLKDNDVLAREEGLEVLTQAGAVAKPALPTIRALLKDRPLTVRFRAAMAVWKIDGDAEPVTPLLADMLADPNRGHRLRAAQLVTQLGPAAEGVAPALVKQLNDKDDGVRAAVGTALEQLGSAAVAALTKGAEAGSPVRRQAVEFLGRLGPRAKDAAAALTAALKDDDVKTRTEAAVALWRVDPSNTAAVPVLVEGFKSTDAVARAQAGNILFAMRPRPKEAAEAFAEALKGNDLVTRVRAADALWDLNGNADEVLPALTEGVKSNAINVRNSALETVRRMGPKAKPLLPALVEILGGTTGPPAPQFTEAFLAIGPDAIAEAVKVIQEKPAVNKQAAAQLLGGAGPDAVEPLRKLTTDNNQSVRMYAVYALGLVGPSAADKVLPVLADALKDKDRNVRAQTLVAYRQLGPEAGDAPPAVIELLKDRDVVLRQSALTAVERLRLDAKTALPILEDMAAKDDSVFNRVRALELCWRLDPKKHPVADVVKQEINLNQHARAADFVARAGDAGRDAVPLLIDAIPTQQGIVRQKLIDAVVAYGADAKAVRPLLVEQLKDAQALARVSAALGLIQTGDAEPALPVLAAALRENTISIQVHERMHAALRKLSADAKPVLPALKQVTSAPDVSIFRVHSALTLAKVDPDQKDAAVAALTDLMGRTTSYIQFEAAAALLELDPKNRRALNVLEQGLSDLNTYNRQVAARHLGRFGADAKAALPALRRAAADETSPARYLAAAAWWRVDGQNAKALAVILDTIKDTTASADMRAQAASALGELGTDAQKEGGPILLEALRDRHSNIRFAAETALKKVDPEAARKAGY